MNCEAVQNRLLAVSEPKRAGSEVRTHLDGCTDCRTFATRLARVEGLLPQIPVPPTNAARKAAFLQSILTAPVAEPRRSPVRVAWYAETRWIATIAAALLLAGGIWVATAGKKPGTTTDTAALRHDLLHKEVDRFVALSKAASPSERLAIWTAVATDLRAETRDVYRVAPEEDIRALGRMFDKAVREGVVKQAKLLPSTLPAAERQKVLADATATLTAAESEAALLSAEAPPQAQPVLQNIVKTARTAKAELDDLAKGGV